MKDNNFHGHSTGFLALIKNLSFSQVTTSHQSSTPTTHYDSAQKKERIRTLEVYIGTFSVAEVKRDKIIRDKSIKFCTNSKALPIKLFKLS